MYPPVDYAVNDDTSNIAPSSEDMTYAALLDRHASEEVITEAMIQSACLHIETAQQFPTACKPEMQEFIEIGKDSALENIATNEQQTAWIKEKSTGMPISVKLSTVMDLSIIAQPAAKTLSCWIRVIR